MHVRGTGRHWLMNLALATMFMAGCHSFTKKKLGDAATRTPATGNVAKESEVELASHNTQVAAPTYAVKPDEKPRSRPPSNSPAVKRLNVLWSDATAEVGGVVRKSGFAAKVYLIGQDNDAPIRSAGRFNFYAWNERSSKKRIEPDLIWSFPAELVAELVRTDSVGTYYSFWLPVGNSDHPQQNFSLQAAFAPESGKPVLSQPAIVNLPGRIRGLTWKEKQDILNVAGNPEGAAATITEEVPAKFPTHPSNRDAAPPPQPRP